MEAGNDLVPTRDGRTVEIRLPELFDYTARELRGMTVLEITHRDDRAAHRTSADAIRSGTHRNIQNEKRYIRKDGEAVWVASRR